MNVPGVQWESRSFATEIQRHNHEESNRPPRSPRLVENVQSEPYAGRDQSNIKNNHTITPFILWVKINGQQIVPQGQGKVFSSFSEVDFCCPQFVLLKILLCPQTSPRTSNNLIDPYCSTSSSSTIPYRQVFHKMLSK